MNKVIKVLEAAALFQQLWNTLYFEPIGFRTTL